MTPLMDALGWLRIAIDFCAIAFCLNYFLSNYGPLRDLTPLAVEVGE